jgi:UTP--glucose-1-phosphate uridylyltransferase
MEVKKAIIPIAGMATRFLPLSKVVPKELWPVVDLPMIHYCLQEIKEAGIKEVIFILNPGNKKVLDYLKPCLKTEKFLKERKKDEVLGELKNLEEMFNDISFSWVLQKQPLGDGNAVLQTARLTAGETVASIFADDIFDAKVPAISQLEKIFKTCQRPVIGLCRVPKEKISHYGIVGVERISSRLYKIKNIIEKPDPSEAPSDLAIVGRYILTPEVFDYLKKAKPSRRGEIYLAEVLNDQMLKDGKLIYGYELEGDWLECGDKQRWLESSMRLALKHPKYGAELRECITKLKL